MYINYKTLIRKSNDEEEVYQLPPLINKHGIISVASDFGKPITLKVLAESFLETSVPVFLVDVKGDWAGMEVKVK